MSGSTMWWWIAGIAAAVGLIWWWATSAGRMRARAGGGAPRADENGDRQPEGGKAPGGTDGEGGDR